MSRELRLPLATAEFNKLALAPITKRIEVSCWNLRWAAYDTPGLLFYPSKSGRLTPISGDVPCLYLARTRETAFYELYGDRIDSARKRGLPFSLTKTELEQRVLLKTTSKLSVNLYDLTAEKSAKKIGMDLATLYTADVDFPRKFAQRLHDHPAKFSGVQYVSRHTQTTCIVIWATRNAALKRISTKRVGSLWDLATFDKTRPVFTVRLFDTEIGVSTVRVGPP